MSAEAGPSHAAGTAPQQWRQFTFFDLEEVKDVDDLGQSPRSLSALQPPIAITSTSPLSPLPPSVIVSSGNLISILDRHFGIERNFAAWEGNGRAQTLIEAGGLLIAVGEEDGSRLPVLKIWDLTREEKKKAGGGPVLLRNVRIQHGQRPHPVSSVALTSNLSHLAVGLGDGTVLIYRHLLQSLTTSPTALTSLPKARVIHESQEPITGLGFREPLSQNLADAASATVSLFIVTTNRVLCAPVSGKGGEARTIDETGSGLGCAVMDWERRDMIVARDDAINRYGPEGRTATFAYEGQKSAVHIFRHSLIITSPPFVPSAASNSATVRHYVAKGAANGDSSILSSDIAKITVFDLQNQLIGYSGTFKDGVRDVFCQWGSIYILGSNGKLSRLEEHTTSEKLDAIYKRSLYSTAISLAENQGIGEAGVADVHRRYGDYLYEKGDFDGAMTQFVQTLGFLQPSYVIRKYLDAQRIANLTTYLQELHSRGLANPDHTTLLLNCYTKTADRERLDAFIKTEARRSDQTGERDELPFDLDTAIRVCRQAGFFEHASYLAAKYGRHEDFLRIQIEDAGQYQDALRYLRSLGPDACQDNLTRYGQMLLQHEPDATTDLLIDLCSGQLGRRAPPVSEEPVAGTSTSNGPAVLSYLGYNHVTNLFSGGGGPRTAGSAEQSNGSVTSVTNGESRPIVDGARAQSGPTYEPPSAQIYFAHFIDHQSLFIRFLESVASALWNQRVDAASALRDDPIPASPAPELASLTPEEEDQRAVWNTLLELYLASTREPEADVARANKRKALILLGRSELPYDPMHALLLCSTFGFTEGLVGLWERMGMYEDVLRFWMQRTRTTPAPSVNGNGHGDPEDKSPSDEVLRYLGLYGPENPQLYPLVLRYLTSSHDIMQKHIDELGRILQTIDEERIMPPLQVVQLLSRNSVASVGAVKEWLRSKVADTRQDIDQDKHLVESYRTETAAKQKEIVDLANPAQPQVSQVTRCSACGAQLDLPSVHFMCKHSYHQRCLSDADPECILCARQHSVIREIRRGQTRLADRHDLFVSEVHEADDGFAVVAGAFGRGIMTRKVAG